MNKEIADKILWGGGIVPKQGNIHNKIKRWVYDRNINTAQPKDQFTKVVEEVGELASGLARHDVDLIKDSIGDIVVTLIALCTTLDIDFEECVQGAYNEIKDRKGKLVDGVFIKEE